MIRRHSIGPVSSRRDRPRGGPPLGACFLPSLRGSTAAERFRAWTGRSGRRYVVSVFPGGAADDDLPLEGGAVLLAVRHEPAGGCRLLWGVAVEPGGVPPCRPVGPGFEWHLHLLAADASERAAVLADLGASAPRPRADIGAVAPWPCADIGAFAPQAVAMSLGRVVSLTASGASMNPPDWRRQRSA